MVVEFIDFYPTIDDKRQGEALNWTESCIWLLASYAFAQLQGDATSPPEEDTTIWTDMTSGTAMLETPETCEQRGGRKYRQQKYLHFVRDAVYAVAHALHDLQASLCGPGVAGVCEDMQHIDSHLLRAYLANVTFNGESTESADGLHWCLQLDCTAWRTDW
jgi:hypothetical protein